MDSKPKKFLITGFPRSRTAWLSALFNLHNDVICFHEPINKFSSLLTLHMNIESQNKEYVGISDSSMGIFSSFYIGYKCPIVIIDRRKNEALESFCEFLDYPKNEAAFIFNKVERGIEEIKASSDFLIVDFNDLDDIETIRNVWKYCVPTLGLDEEKCRIFQNLKIEQNTIKILNEKLNKFEQPKLN